ncbi:unnamed protein product [Paramecium octaurelia]|uniref:Cyclin-dependent kinase 2 homolog n=1 Tax=Paramecium octaurelia TaxID=43137 RepID=A0A8S1VYG5_PAROT|nr:unnamed protein product [Paramecium octaurelia]
MSDLYKINKKISQGAFGTVYEGINVKTGEIVAIKQLFCNKKVLREVHLHEKMNHKNVIKVYQYQVLDQQCSIYMEYCQYDLHQFIQSTLYPLDAEVIRNIAYQILCGIEHIHSRQVVHRDLKPSNIMLHEGIIKIGDFGSAEHLSKLDQNGQYSTEGFSKWYMAPEMLFGKRDYGTEVDIWSFGCIYAELLTGLPLFTGKGEIDQIIHIGNVLGSPTEDNWPKVKELPDQGKINFQHVRPKSFFEYFDLADDDQINFLQATLKYQDRPTATELLKHKYFNKINENFKINAECLPKEQYNPYYKYI